MITRVLDNAWGRKTLFAAINLAIGLILWEGLFVPVYEFLAERDARIEDQRAVLSRLEAVANQEAAVQDFSRRVATQTSTDEFLSGANEGAIEAGLQTRLKTMTETGGARLRSVQKSPARVVDATRYVGARIDVQGPIQALSRLVLTVETSKPYLFISTAVIRPSGATGGRASAAVEPMIEAQLEIYAAVSPQGDSQ